MRTDDFADLLDRDRRAVEATVDLVRGWPAGDLDRPTPCVGWTLTDLLAHMTVQQHGFARAAAGERTELADWAPIPDTDPIAAYAAACRAVIATFAALEDPAAPVVLPEIRPEPLPTAMIVGFHLVDNVVHGWDVARARDTEVTFDEDVLAAALLVARAVPDEGRDRDDATFAPRRPVPGSTSALDETLLLLGRDPAWTAEGAGRRTAG